MRNLSVQPSEAVDESLNVLTHDQCRFVRYYFASHSAEVATVDELVEFISNRAPKDGDALRIRTRLHHMTLPRLDTVGVLEYDAESNTARCRGHPTMEAWIHRLTEQGEAPDVPV